MAGPWMAGAASGCFAGNPDSPLVETAGILLDDDLHVLPKGGQEPHQTIGREVCEPTVEQCRHFRLIDTHERGSGHLGQPSPVNDLPDMTRQLSLRQLLLRLREA